MSNPHEVLTLQPPLRVETIQEDATRLQAELPIVPEVESMDGVMSMHAVRHTTASGNQYWSSYFNEPVGDSVRRIYAEDDKAAFGQALEELRGKDGFFTVCATVDGRWWHGSKAEERVESSLREVFKATASDDQGTEKSLEILNCTASDMTEDELGSLRRVLALVGDFTQGKIFSRMNGIVFQPNEDFKDRDLGGFQFASGVMRLNLDELRADKGVMPPRYARYFQGRDDISAFEINLAHELGHVMDVVTTGEADAHFLDKHNRVWSSLGGRTGDFSAFNVIPGWTHRVVEEDGKQRNEWTFDITRSIEEGGEIPPTSYANSAPEEDMGESFAIASLGGDMSTLSRRQKRIRETIEVAEGEVMGQVTLGIDKQQFEDGVFRPRRLKAVKLNIYEYAS